jgi:hypothetical protein
MNKLHDIQNISFSGTFMRLQVDGKKYEIDLAGQSSRLVRASQKERENVEISPSGYGLHWPELDEDLSIDGLIGIKHPYPLVEAES